MNQIFLASCSATALYALVIPEASVCCILPSCSFCAGFICFDCNNSGKCRKKLTGIVAYIPQPVVAGYLGYVGYFCLTAGIAQGTSLPIHDPSSWILLLTRPDAYTKELATFACYGAILASIKLVKSQAGLPLVLMLIPVTWYALLGCVCMVEGVSWHELQLRLADTGWVSVMQGGGHEPFWKVGYFPSHQGCHSFVLNAFLPCLRLLGLDRNNNILLYSWLLLQS